MEDKEKLEHIQEKYFNFRFENVEKELVRIRELLEESIKDNKSNVENIYNILEKHEKEIDKIKLSQANLQSIKAELKILQKETAFTRITMKDPVKSFLTIGFVTIVVFIALALMDFDPIVKLLTLIKK